MCVNKYYKELQEEKVQAYIENILKNYNITRSKLEKILIAERAGVDNMHEAMKAVNIRIKFGMI